MRVGSILLALLLLAGAIGCDEGGTATPTDAGGVETTPDATTDAGSTPDASSDAALAPGQCLTEADCAPPSEVCALPDSVTVCGTCQEPPDGCQDNASCTADQVCDANRLNDQCFCSSVAQCVAPCTSDEVCLRNTFCDASGQCQPKECAAPTDCPTDYGCVLGTCSRAACTGPADCSGACVNGICFEEPGTCVSPVP